MYCPFCNADDTKVVDSRLVADGGQVVAPGADYLLRALCSLAPLTPALGNILLAAGPLLQVGQLFAEAKQVFAGN